jgi:hypothetical protein
LPSHSFPKKVQVKSCSNIISEVTSYANKLIKRKQSMKGLLISVAVPRSDFFTQNIVSVVTIVALKENRV